MSAAWIEIATLFVGFAMIGFGLSPLAGSSFGQGLSERGCIAALGGVVIVTAATIWKVIG